MTDRELLEMAAKAAGFVRMEYREHTPYVSAEWNGRDLCAWNPLRDDGDALRLAVRMGIGVLFDLQGAAVTAYQQEPHGGYFTEIADDQEPSTATRRAIVRAAAAIGKEMT